VDIRSAFVAHVQPSELVQPRDGAFHDLSLASRVRVVLAATACKQRPDALYVKHDFAKV